MNQKLCLLVCFFVGVLAFYLLKQSCGCNTVVEGGITDYSWGTDGKAGVNGQGCSGCIPRSEHSWCTEDIPAGDKCFGNVGCQCEGDYECAQHLTKNQNNPFYKMGNVLDLVNPQGICKCPDGKTCTSKYVFP